MLSRLSIQVPKEFQMAMRLRGRVVYVAVGSDSRNLGKTSVAAQIAAGLGVSRARQAKVVLESLDEPPENRAKYLRAAAEEARSAFWVPEDITVVVTDGAPPLWLVQKRFADIAQAARKAVDALDAELEDKTHPMTPERFGKLVGGLTDTLGRIQMMAEVSQRDLGES